MRLSRRAAALAADPPPLVTAHFRAADDPFHPGDNPSGYVNLGTAENHLLWDLLAPKLRAARPVREPDTHYQPLYGTAEFRTALARFLTRTRGLSAGDAVDPEDLVVLGGASAALDVLAYALCEPGEGIVLPSPYYNGLDMDFTGRAGARVVPAPLSSVDGFASGPEAIGEALAAARDEGVTVKAIAVMSPHNPLGQVYSAAALTAIAGLARRKALDLIVDEVYAGSVYDGTPHTSVLTLPADVLPPQRRHMVWGFAKDFGLSGFKVGVLHTADPRLRIAARTLAYLAPVSTDTQVLLCDLLADEAWVDHLLAESRRRLATAYQQLTTALTAAGIGYLAASGGHFVWLDLRPALPAPTFDAEYALWHRLFHEARLNISPGAVFHSPEPGWFRLCFATDAALLHEGVTRLTRVLDTPTT